MVLCLELRARLMVEGLRFVVQDLRFKVLVLRFRFWGIGLSVLV